MSETKGTTNVGGDRLRELLGILKLKRVAEIIDDHLTKAEQEATAHSDLLLQLLEAEVAYRTERRIERRIVESALPERKLLSDFDFDFQTGMDKTQIMELASLRFLERGNSLLIAGNSGTGKSHVAKAILLIACQRQHRCLYATGADMLKHLRAGLCDDTLDEKLKEYLNVDVLLIDEVGTDRLEHESTRNASLFYKVINGRYTNTRPTIMTTNVDFEELGDYLGDPLITTTIVDRMVHHSIILNVKGPSWRAHQSKLLNKGSDGAPPAAEPVAKKVKKPRKTEKTTPPPEESP